MDYSKPQFLAGGTFSWTGLGYRYSEPPPPAVSSPKGPLSDDPWMGVAAVLEQAKAGHHGPVETLLARMATSTDPFFVYACATIVGDAGRERELDGLASAMQGWSDTLRSDACETLGNVGGLWLTPAMLEAHRRTRRAGERETILFAISQVLEEEGGPIASSAGAYEDELDQLFQERHRQLVDEHGTERVFLWRGKLFGVRELASEMESYLHQIDKLTGVTGLFIPLRHKFEASTGIDCSRFFRDRKLQPLEVLATLEEFFEGEDYLNYKKGVRYFFGHPVPD